MKKIIRLTESDLVKLVKRVIKEQNTPSAMRQIFTTMKADCPKTVSQLRNVVNIIGSGIDYDTYSKKGTWGEYLELLKKVNSTLLQEMSKVTKTTNPMFKKIQDLCVAQGIQPGDTCVVKFQKLVLAQAKGENSLETESGKIEWADGVVGLATLQSIVLGMIDFFESILKTNPELTNSPLVTQTAKNLVQYGGLKGVEQKVGTKQY